MNTKLTNPEPEHEEDEQRKQKPWNQMEEAAFPAEFLDCFTETAFRAVFDYLKKINARQEAIDLLDLAQALTIEAEEVEKGNGKVRHNTNQALLDYVADASRCIVAIGGSFYAPSGSTVPRQTDVSEKVQEQIENILQRSDSQPKSKKSRRKGK